MHLTKESELNRLEFAQARKDMATKGFIDESVWGGASKWQQAILHQIELTIKSLTIEDLTQLDE